MTVSKYVVDFLKLYESIKIDTNHVPDGSDKYGLFKSPSRDFVRNVDGTSQITEYYEFLASQKSISDSERIEDDEWLEAFVYWVDDFVLTYEYPAMDNGRRCIDIEVTGVPYPMTNEKDHMVYQMLLSITYEREVQ